MVGRELTELFPKVTSVVGDVLLDVQGLPRRGVFQDVSFTVRRGEIVAFAGLVGSGRSEVVRAIFGIDRTTPAPYPGRTPAGRRPYP